MWPWHPNHAPVSEADEETLKRTWVEVGTPEVPFENGWGNAESDPVADIQKLARDLRNEHWVCKGCGRQTNARPERMVTVEELRAQPRALLMQPWQCPDCGSVEWERRC